MVLQIFLDRFSNILGENPVIPITNRELQVLCILVAEKVYMALLPSFLYLIFQNLNQICFAMQENIQVSAFSLLV